jgi:hypothetical protein
VIAFVLIAVARVNIAMVIAEGIVTVKLIVILNKYSHIDIHLKKCYVI